MNSRLQLLTLASLLVLAVFLSSCGGGSGSSSAAPSPGGGSVSSAPQFTSAAILPGTLQGHSYSTTLTVTGGHGPFKWLIAPVSPTALFVQGLTIDANTGVLSGTANWAGTAGFQAQATGSDQQTAIKTFLITAYSPLSAPAGKSTSIAEYLEPFALSPDFQGGVPPLAFSVTGGSLPPGMRIDPTNGSLHGSSIATGNFVATVTISDSFSPAESVSQQLAISVVPRTLQLAPSLPSRIPVNAPYSGKVVATGGTPPYTFSLASGTLPAGFGPIDPATGAVAGVPTTSTFYPFTVRVTDAATPPQSATADYVINVNKALGRNDTVATATPIGNGVIAASISPYIDPPDKAPLTGDSDYYKLVSVSGATVHVSTSARQFDPNNPLDTVLEIVDSNGIRLSNCRQSGSTSTNFTNPCVNDDMSATTKDSAIDLQVPGAPSTPTAFFVHVFDWRGDARPDMVYNLNIDGVTAPLAISTPSAGPAARGLSYTQQFTSLNGNGLTSFAIVAGSLPPGLSLASNGIISGAATTLGSYPFTLQVSETSTPPQKATADFTIQVVTPVAIISPATFPAACVNKPYTFTLQASGGILPIFWTFVSSNWTSVNLDQSTGVFSGTPTTLGTFTGTIGANDSTNHGVAQNVSLTVKTCP